MYYVAHRLFALHDRALGALVARELAANVGADEVFLPFCDTDEEELVADCKGRRLFDLDVDRLQRLNGMVAVLHGPSLDDGVCMEIGYACRRGVSVVVLTTDFQTYGFGPDGAELQFPDPLLEGVVTAVVRVSRMAGPVMSTADRFEAFGCRNTRPLREAAHQAAETLLSVPASTPEVAEPSGGRSHDGIFVEPSPYGRGEQTDAIIRQLRRRGFDVVRALRHQVSGHAAHEEVIRQALQDWRNLQRSRVLVVDANGPETPAGAALMVGAATAAGQRVLAAYEDRSFTFAHGREPNFRNLMIQYSLSGRFRTADELSELLDDA